MRSVLCLALVLLAVPGLALPPALSPTAVEKPASITPPLPPDPAVLRQGGDTIADAYVISALPFSDTGTTAGYTDDYDEACPYPGSTSPDVVYAFTPDMDIAIDIDMCGSGYDTKLYVYDSDLSLVACNDDFYFDEVCGVYVSKLENVPMLAGETYYWIVDGFGGDLGEYVLWVGTVPPCVLDCPPGGVDEGEPPLQDDQPNDFNDGCASQNPDGFQDLQGDPDGNLILCGTGGWFTDQGLGFRDTDWFVATFGPAGTIEITADAELPLDVFELGPQDCNTVAPVQTLAVGPCDPGSLTVTGDPGATVWLWTGSPTLSPPPGTPTPFEFPYVLWLSGLAPGPVATEAASWSGVKALYR